MNFVAIDFETANPNHNSACSIGITPVRDGLVGDTFYSLIRPPELEFSYINTGIHGISENEVVDSPTLSDLWPEIATLIEGHLVVAHNASSTDISILRQSLQAVGIPVPRISYLCSLMLSRHLWPDLPNHKLRTLCDHHSIRLEHHHAGSDSKAAALLVLMGGRKEGMSCPHDLAERCGVSIGELVSYEDWTTCQKITEKPVTNPEPASRSQEEALELLFEDSSRVRKSRPKNNLPEICFTGFPDAVEAALLAIAVGHGYMAKDSVTKKLKILVTGPNAGPSKLKKAQDQGCRILTESEFRSLIDTATNE